MSDFTTAEEEEATDGLLDMQIAAHEEEKYQQRLLDAMSMREPPDADEPIEPPMECGCG